MTYANARVVAKLLEVRTEGFDEASAADQEFDGGEWSGPAWGDLWQRVEEQTLQDAAEILGVTRDSIEREWAQYVHATETAIMDGRAPMRALYF